MNIGKYSGNIDLFQKFRCRATGSFFPIYVLQNMFPVLRLPFNFMEFFLHNIDEI